MLLSYLVTSRARRQLLQLLWADGAEGSVSDLARRAHVSFAAAHRELDAMRAEGLARSDRSGAALVYRRNPGYRQAGLLRRLLREGAAGTAPVSAVDGERARGWLAAAGAPLLVSRPVADRMPRLEEVLAEGLALSHQDATVARVLPLVFWRHWGRLDQDALVDAATGRNERQALGFFLELTGHLGGDPRWDSLAERLRDHRRTRARPFFARAQGRMALALARRRTPALARRWGFLMNMDLESFASAFTKHGEAEVMVPERHDLVLMKVLRGDEHDLQAIEAIHQRSPLDLSILVERFRHEMGATIIAPGRLKGQFLTMIERLFPTDLDEIERRLRARER